MNVVWIFCAILLQNCIRDVSAVGHLGKSVKSSSWMDSLVEYIDEVGFFKQVMFIANLKINRPMEPSTNVGGLFPRIARKFPTRWLTVAELNDSRKSGLPEGVKDDKFTDTSTTFFIYLHRSHQAFDTLPPQTTVDTMLDISASKMGSQFLLVLFSQKLITSLEEFLKYAWSRQLLDFTVIEFMESEAPRTAIGAGREVSIPIVHQYNPFKNEYTRTNWSSETVWFPEKMLDMRGYALKVGVSNRPPFSLATFNQYMEPVSVRGANIDLLEIVAKKLNFTMKYLPDIRKFREISSADNPIGLFNFMQSGKVDIMAYLHPHLSESTKNNSLRTTAVRLDKLCAVVPVLPTVALPLSVGFFQAYFVYFGIVFTFMAVSHVLRFESQSWFPFNIARTLLGISAVRRPTRISERTLYACMLLVSAIFSSSIYSVITGISLDTDAQMEFKTFDELDASGLVPMINNYLFNKSFEHAGAVFYEQKKKAIIVYGSPLPRCTNAAAKHKNVSCLLQIDEAKMAVRKSARYGRPKIKTTQLCFWSDSTAFLLGKGSPYRPRINNVIAILMDTGIVDKCYEQNVNTVWNDPDDGEDNELDTRHNMKVIRNQIYAIAIIGYTLSILTLIGEIIFYRIVRWRKSIIDCA